MYEKWIPVADDDLDEYGLFVYFIAFCPWLSLSSPKFEINN